MKNVFLSLALLAASGFFFPSCMPKTGRNTQEDLISDNIRFAAGQYGRLADVVEDSAKNTGKIPNPKTFVKGKRRFIPPQEWTSGFFPGSIWYLYELTGDEKWKPLAEKYSEALDTIQYFTAHHDVGFMICCSYGNGLRLTGKEAYRKVIVNAARSLSTRFRPGAGIIQSWDANPQKDWECPVIIDNMMNLELLFEATKLSGDSSFYKIAVSHANQTIKNHYRADYSSWHVVDYDPVTGETRHKNTAQGYSDDSAWSRGQMWGVYGFVLCFRETNDSTYLAHAENVLDFIANNPNYPQDGVPYWDFDAPDIPDTYRDVSSACILASALYEISAYSQKRDYKAWADKIVESLSKPDYRARTGENGDFLLMHSVGSIPHNSEIDVPLNYADYYFLEALKRKRDLERMQ